MVARPLQRGEGGGNTGTYLAPNRDATNRCAAPRCTARRAIQVGFFPPPQRGHRDMRSTGFRVNGERRARASEKIVLISFSFGAFSGTCRRRGAWRGLAGLSQRAQGVEGQTL